MLNLCYKELAKRVLSVVLAKCRLKAEERVNEIMWIYRIV